ncbi:hypothetical protein AR687_24595 [Flavobacteriaceae bacterium CRH]|nr:hypothetical protein AR687_24595 [Flavobacteriaceae bacterium CRH]
MQRRNFLKKSLLVALVLGTGGALLASCSSDEENQNYSSDAQLQNVISGKERLYLVNYNVDPAVMKSIKSYRQNRKILDKFIITGFIVETESMTASMKENKNFSIGSYSEKYSLVHYVKPLPVNLAQGNGKNSLKCIKESHAVKNRIIIKEYFV